MDASGNTFINTKRKKLAEQTFRLGEDFSNGIYLVEVRQGDVVKTLKAVKMRMW